MQSLSMIQSLILSVKVAEPAANSASKSNCADRANNINLGGHQRMGAMLVQCCCPVIRCNC